jgi:alpha-glucosidase
VQTNSLQVRWISAACMMLGVYASAAAEVLATVSSPNRAISVAVQLADGGRLAYEVQRNGKPLIAASRLGFLLANAPQMDNGFSLASQAVSEHDDTWEQPWGERRYVRNHYKELRLELVQKALDNRRMALVFRVFDDGIGFRYEFPEQPQLPETRISDELTEFVVAPQAYAWWQQAGEQAALEYAIRKSPLSEVGMANTPLTIRTKDGTHIAFHEAALVDYASMWLRKVEGQKLRAHLTSRTSSVMCRGCTRQNLSACGGRCIWRKAPGAPAHGMARPRPTPGATSISRRRTVSAACWWKAGIWDGMATGPVAVRNLASRSRIRISICRR